MADTKLSALTVDTTRSLADLLYTVTNVATMPVSRQMTVLNFLRESATELTIAAGAVTFTQLNHKLQPQSGTADDLDTISGTTDGQSGVIYVTDFGTDTITIKHNTGNILCVGNADIALSNGCVSWFSNGTKVFVSGGGRSHAASDITSGTMATARLGSGSANNTSFLRGDSVWVKQKLFIPFAQYIATNPISSDAVPYIATVDRTITFIQWSITLYVAGTNDGSNYWTVSLERETDGQVAASVNTSADSGSAYILKTVTTFSPTGYGASDKAIRIHCTPTGSPGGLYAMGTTLEIEV